MRKFLSSLAVLAAMPVGAASAADMALKAPPAPPPAPFSWTGFYVGAEGGGGWVSQQSTVLTQAVAAPAFPVGFVDSPINLSGGLGGFYAGYNYQFNNNFLVGIDGDYNWASLTGSGSDVSPIPGNGDVSYKNDKMSWVSTLTGRLGYANNNWLLFAKGGGAWAGFSTSGYVNSPAGALLNTTTGSSTRDGWTVGGGVEYSFTAHWSAKLEYDYVKFNTVTVTLTQLNAAGVLLGYPTRSTTSDLNMVKGGIAYRF